MQREASTLPSDHCSELSSMALSSWFRRLCSSSKPIYTNLHYSIFHEFRNQSNIIEVPNSKKVQTPLLPWMSSLLPLALAVSAGSLAQQNHENQSLCDASNPDQRGVTFGGKASTDYVVKGSHRKVPQELTDELKAICEDNMTMDHEERDFHGKPQSSYHKAVNIC